MQLLTEYVEILRRPSVPANRVTRKVAVLTLAAIAMLIYYRHAVLGFGFSSPFLVTIVLSFLIAVIFGVFGGLGAGAFYETFLRDVGARSSDLSVPVFVAEWLFAATAPFIGVFVIGLVGWNYAS